MPGIDNFNKVVNASSEITRKQKMELLDEQHRALFPEKYDDKGVRISE